MLYGTVEYVLKEGGESKVDWAARAHLMEEEGKVKMDFYQVYLVSSFCLGRMLMGDLVVECVLTVVFRILLLWLQRSKDRDRMACVMPFEVARDKVKVMK